MEYGLDLNILPQFSTSAYKFFTKNEKHINRVCHNNVLIIMLDGTLYFNENGQPVVIKKNEYYIQKSGLYQEGVLPSSNAKYYYIHFNGSIYDCESCLPISGFADFHSLKKDFDKLDRLVISGGSYTEKSACFYKILSQLKHNAPISEHEKLIADVTGLIAENMEKHYSLEEISKIFGYSKNQMINIFKRQTGKTAYSYITALRINRAKEFLASSNTSVSTVAAQTGFDNYINFYKAFVKHIGCSPQEFREHLHKNLHHNRS